MSNSSLVLEAAIRAFQGECKLDIARLALNDVNLASVIAFAPNAHPTVRDLAALYSDAPYMLAERTDFEPCFHAELRRLIGTRKGNNVIATWAKVAPVGWGRPFFTDLITTVTGTTLTFGHVAALIGPCEKTAASLHHARSIAFAVRRWGQHDPANPTWWTTQVPENDQDRWFHGLIRYPYLLGTCLPWLPPDRASQTPIDDHVIDSGLSAFAEASPTARALHADLLQRMIARATPSHLKGLTELACAMTANEVWARVITLVQESPDGAARVVAAAPWDSLAEPARTAILEHADQSDICAAIAAAQGVKVVNHISRYSAVAFFAALNPAVWDALPPAEQRRWCDEALGYADCLAVRSLGPRSEFLAQATLDDELVRAVKRHTNHNEGALHWTLLPVALRETSTNTARTLIAALTAAPPDVRSFLCIASGNTDPSDIALDCTTLHDPSTLALAVTLQRSVDVNVSIHARCAALHDTLRGQTWKHLAPIIQTLDGATRAALTPDLDLVERLAHPDRKEALRQALTLLASLPPEVAIPTWVALKQQKQQHALSTADAIVNALRDHGDVFLAITDALDDNDLGVALLPLPEGAEQANALRDLARDDPPTAHRLAHALRDQSWIAALHALLTAPPRHADVIWQALPDDVRSKMVAAVATASSDADPISISCPIAALALAAVRSGDIDLQNEGLNVLVTNPDLTRTIWDALPQKTQQALRDHLAFTDLSMTHARSDEPSASRHWRR